MQGEYLIYINKDFGIVVDFVHKTIVEKHGIHESGEKKLRKLLY
jgi:hypothetical protein